MSDQGLNYILDGLRSHELKKITYQNNVLGEKAINNLKQYFSKKLREFVLTNVNIELKILKQVGFGFETAK